MEKKSKEQYPDQDKVNKRTTHLENEEIERMPDSDDDYRLPRELPEEVVPDTGDLQEEAEDDDDLIDEETDISPAELALLEEAELDTSSDETRASDLLDDTDDDGDALNEGPDEDNLFDTGEDLDMPDDILNPDKNADEDEY